VAIRTALMRTGVIGMTPLLDKMHWHKPLSAEFSGADLAKSG
jgi:hypothetical protein